MGTYVGVDIAKSSFDVAHHETGEFRHFKYDQTGIAECTVWLGALKPSLVLMESTGGYELPLLQEPCRACVDHLKPSHPPCHNPSRLGEGEDRHVASPQRCSSR